MHMQMSIFLKGDNAHAHSHPKYISCIAVCMHKKCQGPGIRHKQNNDSWIRDKARQESAGGIKVRALAQTARGAGLSPAWCSIFSCL